jgi:hypothetical protein
MNEYTSPTKPIPRTASDSRVAQVVRFPARRVQPDKPVAPAQQPGVPTPIHEGGDDPGPAAA